MLRPGLGGIRFQLSGNAAARLLLLGRTQPALSAELRPAEHAQADERGSGQAHVEDGVWGRCGEQQDDGLDRNAAVSQAPQAAGRMWDCPDEKDVEGRGHR